ncbi:hypothetical protein FPQ18DRAFT_387381 [Pyronema domesticum]|nr:hypothetical protein FPQ18DRAFT_387381 [Pyronema domesticum]
MEYFMDSLRSLLMTCGISRLPSGHSFRRGAATTARRAGRTDHQIQVLGRWKSESFRVYIAMNHSDIIRLGQRLHGYHADGDSNTSRSAQPNNQATSSTSPPFGPTATAVLYGSRLRR